MTDRNRIDQTSIDQARIDQAQSGGVLIEFALVALALYLLLGALVSFGTMINSAQVAQDVARLAARELALTPLPAAITFEEALDATEERIFDPNQLVVDLLAARDSGLSIDDVFAAMPVVNRALRPVFVFDQVGDLRLLRFPGALLLSPEPTVLNAGLTVGVPQVTSRSDSGETVRWLPVVEELRPDENDPSTGPFSALATGADRGLVALRVNIPATAAGLASYDAPSSWPPRVNAGEAHTAGTAVSEPGSAPPYGILVGAPESTGPYILRGSLGLGEMGALARPVRPFRRVFIGQALFRREVFN